MSLIAWYPLSGDTNDYSGNENHLVVVNGTNPIVLSDTGKTGKAYYKPVKAETSHLKSKNKIDVGGDITMSCWSYIEDNDNSVAGIVSNHNHDTHSGWGMNCVGTGSALQYSVSIGYDDGREYNNKKSKPVGINKWTHFTFTYSHKTDKLKFFINGEYDREFTLGKKPITTQEYITIFAWSNAYLSQPEYRMKGKVQNVKIYDHALSIKEIKEDYKTKLVELRFDTPVEPYNNLVDGMLERGLSGWMAKGSTIELCQPDDISDIPYIKCTRTGSSYDGFRSNSRLVCKPNTQYTLSAEVYIPVGIESELRLYCPESDSSDKLIDYRHYVTIPLNIEKGKWHKFEYTWTSASNAYTYNTGMSLDCFADKPTPLKNIFFARRMQLVENDHRVEMSEFKSTRISDSSGLGNHAYFNNTKPPQWLEESPIGKGSYKFKGDSILDLPNNFLKQENLKQSWTVNIWVKINDLTKDSQQVLTGFNYGLRIHQSLNRALLYLNGGENDSYRYSHTIQQDVWMNMIFAYDQESNYIKIFVNGEDKTNNGPGPSGRTPYGIGSLMQIGTSCYCDLAKFELYATPFTLEDAIAEYKLKASIDSNQVIHSSNIVEKISGEGVPNDNLIYNGFLEYGDNRNFANLKLITDDKVGGFDCVECSGNRDFGMNELIEIDPDARYELSGYFKSVGDGGNSKLYFGFREYDENKNFIIYDYSNLYGQGTKTTLARPLNPGDTKVYLTSTANWASMAAKPHQRILGVFAKRGFPDYRHTDIIVSYTDINTTENSITISPWGRDAYPAGTKVANCTSGNTFKYSGASNVIVPDIWTKYSAIVSGIQPGGEDYAYFRPTTKYIQICALVNYQQNDSFKTRFGRLCLRNLDTNETKFIKPGKPFSVTKKSEVIADEFNTVGPTTGLVLWTDLEYDKLKNRTMKDIKMLKTGVIEASEITPQGKKVLSFNIKDGVREFITCDTMVSTEIMRRGYEHKSYTLHANIKIDKDQMAESIVLIKVGGHSGLLVYGPNALFRTVFHNMDGSAGQSYLVQYNISKYYGQWISLTGVYEMGYLTLFINGERVGQTSIPYDKQFSTYGTVFHIGGMDNELYRLKGAISNARVYERALSSKEIKQLHSTFFNDKYSVNKNGVLNCNDIYER